MKNGTIAYVGEMPDCTFCGENARKANLNGQPKLTVRKAQYDFKTKMGPWAFGCAAHYQLYRFFHELGTGKGQELKLAAEHPLESWESDPAGQS